MNATTDPRVRPASIGGKEDEAWVSVKGGWSYERYGDAWCAMSGRLRTPSDGNPFPSLDRAIAWTLGDLR